MLTPEQMREARKYPEECIVGGCTGKSFRKGVCLEHVRKLGISGPPAPSGYHGRFPQAACPETCMVAGCKDKAWKGVCDMHANILPKNRK